MINYINGKIKGEPYLTSAEEKGEYFTALSNSLLSQGAMSSAPRLKVGNQIVLLGKNLQHFAIRLMDIDTDTVMINKKVIKTVDLWILLLDIMYEIFPAAQAEALSKSKELPKSEHTIQGHDFKVGDEEE